MNYFINALLICLFFVTNSNSLSLLEIANTFDTFYNSSISNQYELNLTTLKSTLIFRNISFIIIYNDRDLNDSARGSRITYRNVSIEILFNLLITPVKSEERQDNQTNIEIFYSSVTLNLNHFQLYSNEQGDFFFSNPIHVNDYSYHLGYMEEFAFFEELKTDNYYILKNYIPEIFINRMRSILLQYPQSLPSHYYNFIKKLLKCDNFFEIESAKI